MKMSLFYSAMLLVLAVLLHFFANAAGIYDMQIQAGFVWMDNLIHAVVGAAIALIGLHSVYAKYPNRGVVFMAVCVALFVLALALGWEVLEFAFWRFFPGPALELKIFSPSLGEAAMDVISNMAGGIVCEMLFLRGSL